MATAFLWPLCSLSLMLLGEQVSVCWKWCVCMLHLSPVAGQNEATGDRREALACLV